ncbi:Chitinase 2 [Pleurotus ostreatus]|nr:Chitinase 2 [Pleurotus ostreatus]
MTAARWFALLSFVCVLATVSAFSNDRSDNLAVYWGQDSGGNQQRLSFYCDDDTIDAFPLAFLYVFFGKGVNPCWIFRIYAANLAVVRSRAPTSRTAPSSLRTSGLVRLKAKLLL